MTNDKFFGRGLPSIVPFRRCSCRRSSPASPTASSTSPAPATARSYSGLYGASSALRVLYPDRREHDHCAGLLHSEAPCGGPAAGPGVGCPCPLGFTICWKSRSATTLSSRLSRTEVHPPRPRPWRPRPHRSLNRRSACQDATTTC